MSAVPRAIFLTVSTFCFSLTCKDAAAEWSDRPYDPSPPPTRADEMTGATLKESHEHQPEHVRIGAIGGIGFPRPLAVEALVKLERIFAIGIEYSVLPTVTISSVDTRAWAVAADARIFPFRGPFFLGVRAGKQRVDAAGSLTVSGRSFPESYSVDTTFVNPRLGLLFTFRPGITIGTDAGVQIPLSNSTSSTLPDGRPETAEVNRVVTFYANKWLPTVDLVRLGVLL